METKWERNGKVWTVELEWKVKVREKEKWYCWCLDIVSKCSIRESVKVKR